MWSYCDCADVKTSFLKSTEMYTYATYAIAGIAIVQLVPSLIFICYRPRSVPIIVQH
ncbi:MAG: hypothetical protein P4M11_14450 [Candidatus Pacebacteria bacterium]|nr:hypothetical protein [Candidatus Paceibacterota bacterium]